MIISVQFKHRGGEFGGRAFSYRCDISDVQVGDIVKAPTSRGESEAKVLAVNVPAGAVDANLLPVLKTVTEYAESNDQQAAIADVLAPDALAKFDISDTGEIIQVKQLPIIEERLRAVQETVERITKEAAALVCTEETIQTVKTRRAEMNKVFSDLEEKRKEVKRSIMGPYDQFEAVYKQCISGPFKEADAALREKIDETEAVMKRRCEETLRNYFTGLCMVHHVDFLTYEQAGVKIDMTSARAKNPQKLKDKLGEFVARVAADVDSIQAMDDAAEVMTEYKKCLDIGRALAVVQDRHRRIEEEKKAAAAREEAKKQTEAAVAKVDAVAPPVEIKNEPSAAEERIFPRFTFTCINATRSQLIKIREFLKQEGIQYE